MAPRTKTKARRQPALSVAAAVGIGLLAVAAVLLWRGGGGEGSAETAPADPGPVHVHGLGVDPADGALFIATHTGLYRVPEGERKARRVGDSLQDTMGFTVAGPNRFLGSGHPDAEGLTRGLPPHLGLIESRDAGRTWESVSLRGEADFHVLRFLRERVYGYDASNDRLLVSADGGRTWSELAKPGPVVDLAVDPADARHVVAASAGGLEEGLFGSRDGGRTWSRVGPLVGLLAWPVAERLYVVDGFGDLHVSRDGGRRFERRGDVGGQPAALLATGAEHVYVALHDGTIKRSGDGGATWGVRSTP